ncbi:TPA: RHS repeat protein [Escherichia coli]|nr:RHS repeat protein [Escherichia coli]
MSTYSSYNPRGQLVSQKDAQGREIRYEYSAAGRHDPQGKIIRSSLFVLNNSHFMFKN